MAGKEDGPGASGSAAANEVHVNVAQDPPVPVLGSPDVVDAGFEERHAARGYKACRGSIVKATFVLCIVGIVLTAVLWGDSDADGCVARATAPDAPPRHGQRLPLPETPRHRGGRLAAGARDAAAAGVAGENGAWIAAAAAACAAARYLSCCPGDI